MQNLHFYVSGATGWLGRYVIETLKKRRPASIAILTRPQSNRQTVDSICAGCDSIKVLQTSDGQIPSLPPETTHIVHCAALVDFHDNSQIFHANAGLTWDLLTKARSLAQLQHFLHISTLTLRTNSPSPFTERSLDEGQTFISPYALTKFLSEVLIHKFHKPLPISIVRLGSVIASTEGDFDARGDWFYQTLRLWIKHRIETLPLGPEQFIYPIPVDEAARLVVEISQHPNESKTVLHLPSSMGPTVHEIFDVLSRTFERPEPQLYSQDSKGWENAYANLKPGVRRIVDRIYPPPPPGARLAEVDSSFTQQWLNDRNIETHNLTDDYWISMAERLFPNETQALKNAECVNTN